MENYLKVVNKLSISDDNSKKDDNRLGSQKI